MKKVAETGAEMTRAQVAASAGRRKRKVECCQGELSYSTSFLQLRRSRRLRVAVTPEENSTENTADSNSNDRCASCCSSKGSSDQVENDNSKFGDLGMEEEEESAEIVTSTYESENGRERRETTPSSEVQAESGEMESTAVRPSSSSSEENFSRRRRSGDDKMPSKAELEEFFSAAEKKLHDQFAQKYNFDVVEEQPLEGRYEWVRVKP